VPFDEVVEWMAEHADMSWIDYRQWCEKREAKSSLQDMKRGYQEWLTNAEKVEPFPHSCDKHLSGAKSCPSCGTRAEDLLWEYLSVAYVYGRLAGHGWSGWATICKRCELRVERFCDSNWVS
jgi:hypothetical protein